MPDLHPVHALFAVTSTVLFEQDGKTVAQYSPRYGPYRVTERNQTFVGDLVDSARAVVVGMSRPVIANAARTGEDA